MAWLTKKDDTVRDCIMLSLVIQMMFPTMGAMLLDGGQVFQIMIYAAVAYWVGLSVVMVRRRNQLTRADKILIRWAFLMLLMVSSFVTQFIWHLRGY
jgi:hypothetical protein